MLTLAGLVSAAGALVLATHVAPVSIWAMNFAMMFALALGIDYALFIVVRFRAALARRADDPDRAGAAIAALAETMDTAAKAVAFSGATVLVALSTVLLVPSPAFRSMALGIMLSVVAVLAATLTLLPAVLGRLGHRIDAGRIRPPVRRGRRGRCVERVDRVDHRPAGVERLLHHWGAVLHRRPWVAGGLVLVVLGILAAPVLSLRTGMPSITIIPQSETARAGYQQVSAAFGAGAPGTLTAAGTAPGGGGGVLGFACAAWAFGPEQFCRNQPRASGEE
jgi:RND superfamily putative drug exporter